MTDGCDGLRLDPTGRTVAPPLTPSPAPPPLPEGYYVDVPGARLWTVDTGGDGDVVLLLHSAVGSVPHWAYQLAPLAEAGFRVVAYDRRRHGRSEAETDADPAEDCRVLIRSLELEGIHLVGIAQGGRVATEVALASPGLVKTLALVASNAGVRPDPVSPGALPLMPKDFTTYPTWFTELGAPYRSVDPEGTQRWLGLGKNAHPPGLTSPLRKLGVASVATLDIPVLLLGGDADGFTPPPVIRRLAPAFQDASVAILPECGHSPQWERPELFNDVLLAFLSVSSSVTSD